MTSVSILKWLRSFKTRVSIWGGLTFSYGLEHTLSYTFLYFLGIVDLTSRNGILQNAPQLLTEELKLLCNVTVTSTKSLAISSWMIRTESIIVTGLEMENGSTNSIEVDFPWQTMMCSTLGFSSLKKVPFAVNLCSHDVSFVLLIWDGQDLKREC